MASGFSGGFGGGVLGFSAAVSSWNFPRTSTLGDYIREAQLSDFLYTFGGPVSSPSPTYWDPGPSARTITASRELPGTAHYIPPVSVGENGGGSSGDGVVVQFPGVILPTVGIRTPDFQNEGQPPLIFSPAPIILPGQTDPGREEHETEEGPMAHSWTHLGSQIVAGLFPGTATQAFGFSGPTGVGAGSGNGGIPPGGGAIPSVEQVAAYSGACPPRKTRTLTIDCETGQEIKRKRRRRRALLTQGDMGVLFQIASLPNNANVRVALAGAIRR